jgi:undecaprenyl diphosphate synthase
MDSTAIAAMRKDFDFSSSREEELFDLIDWSKCPRHIAFIMDGNGRWATAQGKSRTHGHKMGVQSVYEMVEVCGKLPVEYATFYAFSTENWRRSSMEVKSLMTLFSSSLNKYLKEMMEKDVRIEVIGDLDGMGKRIQSEFEEAREQTKDNTKICMTLALNYSGRNDLSHACRALAQEVKAGRLEPEQIDEELISHSLYTSYLPEPELLIRTSGEQRLSNFLLWESAYTEFYFESVHWPEYRQLQLFEAIAAYQGRQRRFGAV